MHVNSVCSYLPLRLGPLHTRVLRQERHTSHLPYVLRVLHNHSVAVCKTYTLFDSLLPHVMPFLPEWNVGTYVPQRTFMTPFRSDSGLTYRMSVNEWFVMKSRWFADGDYGISWAFKY